MIKVLGKLFKEILEDYDLGDTAPNFLTRSSSATWIAPLPTLLFAFSTSLLLLRCGGDCIAVSWASTFGLGCCLINGGVIGLVIETKNSSMLYASCLDQIEPS